MKKEKAVDIHTVVARSEDVLVSEVDGKVVMMSIEKGTYSGLDAIGSEIWRPMSVSEICDILMGSYAVKRGCCEKDVIAFLNDLASDDTIRIVEDDAG
jgi:hypothetical protein